MTDCLAAIAARHCKRAFQDRPVPREILEEVLRIAAHAPSSRNIQPWKVAVMTGAARDALSRDLCRQFDRGVEPHPDYANKPSDLGPPCDERARAYGGAMLAWKGIDRHDAESRREHARRNFVFFNAPTELIFHLGAEAVPGSFLAMGCFLQNVMLGLVAKGLGSCPQYSIAGYADVVRKHLGFGADRLIVCGLAVGYVDEEARVNSFVPRRAELDEYLQWFS